MPVSMTADPFAFDSHMMIIVGCAAFAGLFVLFMLVRALVGTRSSMPKVQAGGRQSRRQQQEKNAAIALDKMPGLLWIAESDPNTRKLSNGWSDLVGRQSPGGIDWRTLLHPEDREEAEAAVIRAIERNAGFSIEYRVRRFDGAWRWILDEAEPHDNGDGHGWIGFARDVTERRKLEDAWRDQVSRLTEKNQQLDKEIERLEERCIELERSRPIGSVPGMPGMPMGIPGEGEGDAAPADDGATKRVHVRLPMENVESNLGPVLNLSLGGVAIQCQKPPVDELVDLEIRSGDDEIPVRAEIVWQKKDGFRKYELGLRFLNVDEKVSRRLAKVATLHRFRRAIEEEAV